jgi:hypothetical protein
MQFNAKENGPGGGIHVQCMYNDARDRGLLLVAPVLICIIVTMNFHFQDGDFFTFQRGSDLKRLRRCHEVLEQKRNGMKNAVLPSSATAKTSNAPLSVTPAPTLVGACCLSTLHAN